MRIKDAVKAAEPYTKAMDAGTLKPIERPVAPPSPLPPMEGPEGGLNMFLKCPLPGISVSPDSLRQFYRRGIPQRRVIPPSPLTTSK